jgi:BatD DUF11 like domain
MKLKIIFALILLLCTQLSLAEITVSVDRNPVVADESFKLIFESDQKVQSEPDFSPLKKVITILNTGHRSNTQIIPGEIKRSHQWILTVIANKTGTIEIPAIRFGKELSKPTKLSVVASAPPKVGGNTEDIFIDVEVNNENPYVQAQVILTVKLYRAVQTSNSTLSDPEISGGQAVINRLGDDKSFETRIKGKRYLIIQRQYAIFPQSSGLLKIEPLVFQGQTGASGFFNFDPFGPQPKSIVKRSDSIVLDIKPIPESFTGKTWLPANNINIQEQWSVDPNKLEQGDATTRILTLTAEGLASSHLPTIESFLPDQLKQYPDQPELEEKNNKNGYVGIRREKMAIIPTEAGDFVLPAIKIPWWNTVTDKMELAELPERTIHVNASGTIPVDNIKQEQKAEEENITPEKSELTSSNEIGTVIETAQESPYWKWSSILFLLVWLFTLFLLIKEKKRKNINSQQSKELSKRFNLKQLKQACVKNNAKETETVLLDWAKDKWPKENINNINAIKKYCNKELELKIDELNVALYGNKEIPWNGGAFLQCFESQKFINEVESKDNGELEPLYKV